MVKKRSPAGKKYDMQTGRKDMYDYWMAVRENQKSRCKQRGIKLPALQAEEYMALVEAPRPSTRLRSKDTEMSCRDEVSMQAWLPGRGSRE